MRHAEELDFLQGLFPGRAMISIPEAAKALGVSPQSLRIDPNLDKTVYGKQTRVTLVSLARFMVRAR